MIVTDLDLVGKTSKTPIQCRPFDVGTYEDDIDEKETLDEESRQRLKLTAGNTTR